MNFRDLHEHLRLELLRRIERGVLTGSLLARQTGFRQAHISNVLNRRRLFSLEGLDRILAAQNISIEQIVPFEHPLDSRLPSRAAETSLIPIASPSEVLHRPTVQHDGAHSLRLPTACLRDNRSRPAPQRVHWQRYVAVTLDREQAEPMHPLLTIGSVVVIDRHYTSLAHYHAPHPTLYAVNYGGSLLFRFVSLEDCHLVLRPLSLEHPVRLLRLGTHAQPADFIMGRACLLLTGI
ncbi:MAG: helix-turn-helix domain-containing protein [Acidobacteriaceae bacterium]|nr:helix-turn-helix domain-containing protein [Acidobacteriaceae bacterium]